MNPAGDSSGALNPGEIFEIFEMKFPQQSRGVERIEIEH
jgi:hypothetical protein